MKHSIFLYILFISLIVGLPVRSQNLQFHHFTTDEGLSHNSVISIYQDERGFIWLGTREGLNLYNGKEFKIYKHQKNNPNSLLNNEVSQITGDGKGKIYFMMDNGITAYDSKLERFTPLVSGHTTAIYYDKHIYYACHNLLYRYENENPQLIYKLPESTIITNLHQHGDSILIGTADAGLYLLRNKTTLSHLIPKGRVYDIFRDSEGWIWVTSHDGQGLYILHDGKIHQLQHSPLDKGSISSNQTHVCCEDEHGDIWVGTFDGLNRYDKKSRKFTRYYQKAEKNKLSESSIWSLLCDRQGNIWAGTYYGGVNLFNPSRQIYSTYNVSTVESEGLSSPTVGQMVEDKQRNLWICTEGGGVCRYNLDSGVFKWYKHDVRSNSISHNHAKSVYYDDTRNAIWIGTHLGGLNKLDLNSGKLTCYVHRDGDSTSLPSNIVMDIQPYSDDELLLAVIGGVTLFNPQTGKCRSFFEDKELRTKTAYSVKLLQDERKVVWMANISRGLWAYDPKSKRLNSYSSAGISRDKVNSIYEDSRKRLWFCTNGGGLYLYSGGTDSFENFDTSAGGLVSDVIYSIRELAPDRLLMTTDKGFSILEYEQKRFFNYDKYKDIPLTSINENSLYVTATGEVFIGGMNGMVSFHEKDLNVTPRTYGIYPYRLFANDRKVEAGDETGILPEGLTSIREFSLPAKYSVFTLEYTTTDYIPLGKDEIIYRLEGFSERWMKLSEQNRITYTNLSPGTYTLVVKTANEDNLNVPESRIQIHILPPFYRTWWAYLIYTLAFIILIWLLARNYKSRLKLRESLKYEERHIKDLEELNQSKLRFFTNISHEFRTPLAIIIGQMEILLENRALSKNVQASIRKVYNNCLQLRELITELLDFRKQTQGHMTLKVSEHNLVRFLQEHYASFQDYAKRKEINYTFVHIQDELPVWYDAKQLRKVMNNLIFNAFKYTPHGGKITVSVRKVNREAVIEVTDSGVGIKPQDIDRIFNRFYQVDNAGFSSEKGTGIGLALTKGIVELHHGSIEVYSELGIETTFRVHLLLGNEHFTPEEIALPSDDGQEQVSLEMPLLLPLSLANDAEETEGEDSEDVTTIEALSEVNEEFVAKRYKILIVEDNKELRDMLVQLFESFYLVLTAADGEEGWQTVKNECPDIVVSDVVMPRMSGIELCEKIKGCIDTCHIPVVLLTAKTAIEHRIEGFVSGADDYIAKPFNVKLLLSRCNNLVNSRILLQEKYHSLSQAMPKMAGQNTVDKLFIDRATEVVYKHIGNMDFSMDVFATEMGVARTKLFTKLKAVTNQTPAEFILTIRLKEAAVMLKLHPEYNISEISDRLGFSSPKYFRKCFKEKYHITPVDYRNGKTEQEENMFVEPNEE